MIKTFRDKATEDVFTGENSKEARTLPKDRWSVMKRKLDMIHMATELRDLSQLPGNKFQSLKETNPGYYSIRVNDQFRVTFRFSGGDAFDVAIEDYHDGSREK
jgi:proteic killer suppression protein